MGDFLITWYAKEYDDYGYNPVGELKIERLTNVTEDYVDGYILAIARHTPIYGELIKERLG